MRGFKRSNWNHKTARADWQQSDKRQPDEQQPLSQRLDENITELRRVYADCADLSFHSLRIGELAEAMLVFHISMCDDEQLNMFILRPLASDAGRLTAATPAQLLNLLPIAAANTVRTLEDAIDIISNGMPLLFIDGSEEALSFGLQKIEHRSIEEPSAESTVRGPRESFNEVLSINLSMLRRKMKSPKMKLLTMTIGEYTRTDIAILYLEGAANPATVDEALKRLAAIDTDGILESEYIEEWIADSPYSPFPQMIATERPDVVCANLLEGRFAILIDGTPFALIAPVTLFSMLQSVEDYYQHFIMSTFVRWLRYVFFLLSLLLPSAYVAITTYHQEMIPTVLLLSIAKAREEIPFPALVEALIMEIAFEALREAGVRLPRQVGSAVSIVGALIIGQAATSAGIVSAPMVIVVATTGIASFMIPRYAAGISSRLLRFPIMLLAGTLGLIGMMLGLILIVIHLSSLRSFGVPYLSPVTPASMGTIRDVIWRAPAWMNEARKERHSGRSSPSGNKK
ncbi:spore germination protein [Paenibacillus sp. Leaf72]|uniref:spore germination protein n=1 Tax=Paenibacillus sp. Leaf72 TaxID=1736234 RepID=UPI0009D6FAA8|nr:spore germination protein [Paenibacillus sp. Leaf72]